MRATFSPSPMPTICEVGASISRIPGPPLGPSNLITITSPSFIFPLEISSIADSSLSKTTAFPLNFIIDGLTPLDLIIAPLGAKLPNNTAMPPSLR